MTSPTNSQNVKYLAINAARSPRIYIFEYTPTISNWRGFQLLDEAYVPSTKKWYKLLSLAGNQADWQLQASDTSDFISEVVTDAGTAIPVANIVNMLGGTGCNTSASGNTITINSTGGGYEWQVVTTPTKTIETNKAYFANFALGVTFTLPATANVGDSFKIVSVDGIVTINQLANQQIIFGNTTTTLGIAGALIGTSIGDVIEIACWNTDNNWIVINGPQGNFGVI
jgi:hypothetical protein